MIPEAVSWIAPLLLIPGVGLLLVSSSARFEALHIEIHDLLHDSSLEAPACAGHVLGRARTLQFAMTTLYIAVMLLSSAGLLGALANWGYEIFYGFAWLCTTLAVFSIFLASILLIRDSVTSFRIINEHALAVSLRKIS